MPYTYLLTHRSTGKRYYGVRTVHDVDPHNDLWRYYFSSSSSVKSIIEDEGLDAFDYEVRRTFDTADAATKWETRVLKRMHVKDSPNWLNQNDRPAPPILEGEKNGFYGKKHDVETVKLLSKKAQKRWTKNRKRYLESMKDRKAPVISDEIRQEMSERGKRNMAKIYPNGRLQKNNPMYGRRHNADAIIKMKQAKSGIFDGDKNPMYGKTHTDEARQKVALARRNRRWINQNGKTKSVKTDELESYVLAGWKLGR